MTLHDTALAVSLVGALMGIAVPIWYWRRARAQRLHRDHTPHILHPVALPQDNRAIDMMIKDLTDPH